MAASIQQQWQTDEQLAQQHFEDGYKQEAHRRARKPTEREDGGCSDELEHNHTEGTASATTLYADDGDYDANARLPDCERHDRKRDKFARLWQLNAGRDTHHASGKTYKDAECHKVDQNARDRRRFTHALCSRLGLGENATARALHLAVTTEPRPFNFLGGFDVFLLAVVLHAANENGEILRLDCEAFHRIRKRWDVDRETLAKATSKLAGG